MKAYLAALRAVSSINFAPQQERIAPAPWQRVFMRGLLGLLWGFAGIVVLWLMPGDRIVGALLATALVIWLRHLLCRPEERDGVVEVSAAFTPENVKGEKDAYYHQVAFNIALVLRPFCIFVLLLNSNWLWLGIAAAFSVAISFESRKTIENPLGSHWICAFAFTLLLTAITSKIFPQQSGMFVVGVLSCVICWLAPLVLERFNLNFTEPGTMYVGESLALLLGLVAQAV